MSTVRQQHQAASPRKKQTSQLFVRDDIGVAMHFERVRDYLDEKLKSVHNKESCESILALFLTLASEKDGAWFSWLHAQEAMAFMVEVGLKASHRSYYRAVENLKKTGIIQEVLPYTWKNKKVIAGQCTVFLIDPLLVAFVQATDRILTPDDKEEAVGLAKAAARRTKQSPNKELFEVSRHVRCEELKVEDFISAVEADDGYQEPEPEVDVDELERRSFELDAEEEAEIAAHQEYLNAMGSIDEEPCDDCHREPEIDVEEQEDRESTEEVCQVYGSCLATVPSSRLVTRRETLLEVGYR